MLSGQCVSLLRRVPLLRSVPPLGTESLFESVSLLEDVHGANENVTFFG